ncbi:MAG: MBL fold metallo-hydrolase [Phycisphaerae bacterium]|nr:MBL fold metallo-hydrolase [Phycisphaerae bacterium]
MSLNHTIVSIGTLSRNRFWNEQEARRVAHSTTTLVRSGSTAILIDPGLPAELLVRRLDERAGIGVGDIDTVFLTNFRPAHRRALPALSKSTWLMHEPEIEAMRRHLAEMRRNLLDEGPAGKGQSEEELLGLIGAEESLLERVQSAPEKLTPAVHLYPTAGVTPGASGLLLAGPARTTIVAGDAVVTRDYFEGGRVWEHAEDVEEAKRSFMDILEVADEIIPGHDNAFAVFGR